MTLRDFPPCAQEPLPAAADWTVTVQNKAEPLTAWTEPACSPALSPARDTGVWLRAVVTRAPRVWRCRPRHSGSRGAEPPIPLVRTNRREHTLGAGVCLSPGASRSCGLSPSPTPRRTALQLSLGRRLMKGICELCLPGQSANKPDSHCLHPPFIGPPRPLFQAPSPGSSRRPAGTPGSAGVDCLPAALGSPPGCFPFGSMLLDTHLSHVVSAWTVLASAPQLHCKARLFDLSSLSAQHHTRNNLTGDEMSCDSSLLLFSRQVISDSL